MTELSSFVKNWKGARPLPSLIVLAVFLSLWFTPPPSGLSIEGWHLFAIFISTIVGFITKPLPMGALALLAGCIAALSNTLTLNDVLSSFSSSIIWLIVSAFMLAQGFIKTGLGARIAYHFIKLLGKSPIGLAYGLTFTEFVFSPVTPSNTARGAGIIFPIIRGLCKEYGSDPEKGTERKMGSYLTLLLYQVNVITSAMFITATAPNPLAVILSAEHGVEITWVLWATAALVPGLINLLLLPLFMYMVHPPELKKTPEAPNFARKKLAELGPMKTDEILMLIVFALLLGMWVFGHLLGISPTTAGLTGLTILLVTGVLKWDDVIKEKDAWNTFIWMAVLIMLSTKLAKLGVSEWLNTYITAAVSGYHWITVFAFVGLFYFYSHYLFASTTAHMSALFGSMLAVCIAAGTPPLYTALMFGFASSLCAGLTNYGTGTAPVYFGANFVPLRQWWGVGFVMSVFNLAIWGVVGTAWWKIIGFC